MIWRGLLFILVPLVQLNVLAAEAYIGNNRSWNSRDLNFHRRPLNVDSNSGPITQSIHTIPRPLPKPIEVPSEVQAPEVVYSKQPVTEDTYEPPHRGRSFIQGAQRFNLRRPGLPRQPVPESLPVDVSREPVEITPEKAPIEVAPEPKPIAPKLEPIAPEPEPIAPVPAPLEPEVLEIVPEPTPLPRTISLEEPASTEDIEIIPNASRSPSPTRPTSRHYLMPRPIPRPSNINRSTLPPQPEIVTTNAPIRSVTILNDEPERIAVSTTEVEDLAWSTQTEPSTIMELSSPPVELIGKSIPPEIEEEPSFVIEEEDPELVENKEPIVTPMDLIEITVTQPPPPIIEESIPVPVASLPVRVGIRKRRPVTKKPTTQPWIAPSRVPVKPAPPATVRPVVPQVTPTNPPIQSGKSWRRSNTEAPVELMDYQCRQSNGYYSVANECDSYVECKSYIAMMSSCPDGLHFDARAIWPEYPCAYPSEVQCEGNAIRQKSQPTADCPSQYGFFPMANSDCSKYITCQEGYATIMNCPPGLVFNAETSTCDWPENVPTCSPDVFRGFKCPEPPLEEDGTISDMLLKYSFNQSCKEYVACQRGHPRLLKCDAGLSFDEESQVCIDSEYVTNCRN